MPRHTLPRNTIVKGNCLDFLPELPAASVDFILTDPPYLTRYRARDGRTVPNDDNDAWIRPAFAEMYHVLKPDSYCVSFYGWPRADSFIQAYRAAGFRVIGHFVFPKGYASGTRHVRRQHETAHLLAKGEPSIPVNPPPDVIGWRYTGNRLHPTQKPLCVLLPLVEAFSIERGIVLDPFAGSGSSLVAAKQLRRNYLGVELSPEYHAIAVRRLAQAALRSLPQTGAR